MRHCPPVASGQGTPTRSSKQIRKDGEGAHGRFHELSRKTRGSPAGRGGSSLDRWRHKPM